MWSKQLNSRSTYIYTTDLNSTSSLYNNLINAYLLYLASATHSLGFVCHNYPTPSPDSWRTHCLADAYPLSAHGNVHRIVAFIANWLSTPRGLQLSMPCSLQCVYRKISFDAEWLSTPRDLNASWPQRLIVFPHLCVHARTTFVKAWCHQRIADT